MHSVSSGPAKRLDFNTLDLEVKVSELRKPKLASL